MSSKKQLLLDNFLQRTKNRINVTSRCIDFLFSCHIYAAVFLFRSKQSLKSCNNLLHSMFPRKHSMFPRNFKWRDLTSIRNTILLCIELPSNYAIRKIFMVLMIKDNLYYYLMQKSNMHLDFCWTIFIGLWNRIIIFWSQ